MSRLDRRDFITGAAACAAYASLGRGVDGDVCKVTPNIGANVEALYAPYTEGSLLWIDGIWNDGLGVHSSNINAPKNISSGHVMTRRFTSEENIAGSNCLLFSENSSFYEDIESFDTTEDFTIEYVAQIPRFSQISSIYFNQCFSCGDIGVNIQGSHGYGFTDNVGAHGNWVPQINDPIYICMIFNGSRNLIDTYKNGERFTGNRSTTWSYGRYNLTRRINVGSSYTNYAYYGVKIFRNMLYNRRLSDKEISYHYAVDRARFNLP